jgi:Ca2+-binding RTX toxin-like protein
MAAIIPVLNNLDSGAGSLRDAIAVAQNGDTIDLSGVSGTIAFASTIDTTTDLTIKGPGADVLSLDGANSVRLFSTWGTVSIQDLKITHGFSYDGGALYAAGNLSLKRVTLDDNHGQFKGGAIYADVGSSLSMIDCTATNNTNYNPGNESYGGVLWADQSNVTISGSTFASNSATAGAGYYNTAYGGALVLWSGTNTTIANSTFTNNYVLGGSGNYNRFGYGGAILSAGDASTVITNCTIVGNTAYAGPSGSSEGGGVMFFSAGANQITNTIIAQNSAVNGPDLGNFGAVASGGHNLLGVLDNAWGVETDQIGNSGTPLDPKLSTLADNGGNTWTMALLTDSTAIDAGDSLAAPATDQRGLYRNGTADVGAFEFNGLVDSPPAFSSSGVTSATADSAYTYDITATDSDSGDTLTITAPTKPSWLTLTDNGDGTATLSGTPTNTDAGNNSVTLRVSDGIATTDQTFTVAVAAINHDPSFTSTSVTSATSESLYTYDITTTDPESGDTLTITADTLPSWLTFTDNEDGTATLSGTPTNADAGSNADNSVVLIVDDGTSFAMQSFSIDVAAINHAPAFTSDAVLTATSEQVYTYNITATDSDGNPLSMNAQVLPTWLTFTDHGDGTATLTGTPTNANVGTNHVELKLSDGQPNSLNTYDLQYFDIDVSAINHAPTFSSTAVTTATSESLYSYTITGSDSDGDPVTFDNLTLPAWLTLVDHGDGTATLSGTPTNADAASNADNTVLLIVDDGTDIDTQLFSIDVTAINHAPTFSSTAPTTVTSEQLYTYTISTTDSDGNPVTISADTLPSWMTLTDNEDGTATLSGTPLNANAGNNSVVLKVSDGTMSDTQSFTVAVTAINHAPTFTSTTTGKTTATSETLYSYTISTTDSDGNPLTITAPTKPSWLTLVDNGNGTATLSGTPLNANSGNNSVVLRVSDGTTTTDQSYTIAVSAINHAPAFSSTAITTAMGGKSYSYNVSTTDADGNPLTITGSTLPAWMTVTDNHNGTATLSGTPGDGDYGIDAVVLQVNDGTTSVQQSFNVNIGLQDSYLDANGILHVNGSESADVIVVSTRGDQVRVSRNGIIKNYAASKVSGVEARGLGGADAITLNIPGLRSYAIGGDGNDTITGGEQDDILTGGAGADRIMGLGGNDRLNGMGGADRMYGGEGSDRLYGGDANDTIDGGSGVDRFYGEAGNDVFIANDKKHDNLYGGDGANSAIVDTLLDDSSDVGTFLAPGSVAKKHRR